MLYKSKKPSIHAGLNVHKNVHKMSQKLSSYFVFVMLDYDSVFYFLLFLLYFLDFVILFVIHHTKV